MSVAFNKDGVKIGLLASEEPPAHDGRGKTERIRALESLLPLLKEQKGTWFRIGEFPVKSAASSQVTRLRKRTEGYEWAARVNGKGSVLWGRYVGGKK